MDRASVRIHLSALLAKLMRVVVNKPTNSRSPSSSLEIGSDIDMVRLFEDVVEVAWASDQKEQASQPDKSSPMSRMRRYVAVDAPVTRNERMSLILDIDGGQWMFSCIPGAFQRILMNLVTNSLKFTREGSVHVKLSQEFGTSQQQGTSTDGKSVIVLSVKDTGIGMSADFLRYKLYTPFAQQSSFTAGTGKASQYLLRFKRLIC